MRKKTVFMTLLVLVLLGAAAFFFFIQPKAAFDGDRVKSTDPPQFSLRFNILNKDDTETLTLQEGDALRVSWQIDGGSVDVLIAMAGEEPIYQANNRGKGDTAEFEMTIPKTGDYTLSVTGRNAKGWIEFSEASHE